MPYRTDFHFTAVAFTVNVCNDSNLFLNDFDMKYMFNISQVVQSSYGM